MKVNFLYTNAVITADIDIWYENITRYSADIGFYINSYSGLNDDDEEFKPDRFEVSKLVRSWKEEIAAEDHEGKKEMEIEMKKEL